MTFLLDTNACIRFLNGTSLPLVRQMRAHPPADLRLSAVVEAELIASARKSVSGPHGRDCTAKWTCIMLVATSQAATHAPARRPAACAPLSSVTLVSRAPTSASSPCAPTSRCGSGTTRSTENTAAASVGDVTAPSRTASSHGIPSR